MILFSVVINLSLLLIVDAITSENLTQPDDPRITQLPATHYECSKQNNLRQFCLNWFRKCTQDTSGIEFSRTFAPVFIRAKAKTKKVFRCSATSQKSRVFCAQGAQDEIYIHN